MARGVNGSAVQRARHPVRNALIAIVVIGGVMAAFWFSDGMSVGGDVRDVDRVLLVAAAPDETGDVVAQVVAIADVSQRPAALEPVSPDLRVTIPGTTYETLADAYPFGGGEGVAAAFGRAEGADQLPYVALGPDAFAAALEHAAPVKLRLPADMSVYDGETLFTLTEGRRSLDAAEVLAVLKGAPYLGEDDREALDAELVGLLAEAVIASPDDALRTNLSPEALDTVRAALATGE